MRPLRPLSSTTNPSALPAPSRLLAVLTAAGLAATGMLGAAGAAQAAAPTPITTEVRAAAAQRVVTATDPTPALRTYITGVYRDLFGRAPDAAGLDSWTRSLLNGTPRVAVANSITASAEFRSGLITGSYVSYLGRAPESSGLAFWLGLLNSGAVIPQMETGFLDSNEYYAQSGGNPSGWVTRLYGHILNRTASAQDIEYWTGRLATGSTRTAVTWGFLTSAERLGTVVDGYYQRLLGRSIDAGGRASWVGALQSGTRLEQVIGSLVASDEYINRNGGPVTITAPVPSGTTTGVPAGTALRVHDGDLTVTTAGTVIDGLDIRGYLRVKAPNVTVRNTIVRGRPGLTSYMSLVQASSTGLTITDSELLAAHPTPYVDGIVGSGFTLDRVNIHGVVDSVKVTGNDVLVQSSWLHDNLYYLQDPNYGNTPTHDDNIQIQRGNNITIRNTVMSSTHNAAVMITQDSGAVSNLTFTANRADGGACTINVAEKSYGPIRGLSITNNAFGTATRNAHCAVLMPATTAAISTTTGNTFTDGHPFAISRG